MFSWMRGLFKKDEAPKDFYSPKEREIFQYFDGEKIVRADPMTIYRRFARVQSDLFVSGKIAVSPSKDAEKAQLDYIQYIREIFQVKPFEEGGLTEVETGLLLDYFLGYVDSLKKNTSPTATLQEEISPTTESSSGESPPTPSTSDSGSTESESSTGGPSPSPSEQESPSNP